ncbi:MAG TPA: His-Xaa-Ser system protein HxsD [Sedimentisphaerales bacterium]|nr:His-Xaa-Ser system protein HxsD [Sedimentisphaerales bacterium]
MNPGNLEHMPNGKVKVSLDVGLYSRDAILSTAYRFTHKCFINLLSYGVEIAHVEFSNKNDDKSDLTVLVNEFLNELIDQQLRFRINSETKDIQRAIVKEAFAPLENIPGSD